MGFEVGRVFKLEWPETHFLHGALVRMRSCSIGLSLSIDRDMLWDDLVKVMCQHVVEWDLERDGIPLDPTQPDLLMGLMDRPVIYAIVKEWMSASSGVSAPLDAASADGQAPQDTEELERLMPMEAP